MLKRARQEFFDSLRLRLGIRFTKLQESLQVVGLKHYQAQYFGIRGLTRSKATREIAQERRESRLELAREGLQIMRWPYYHDVHDSHRLSLLARQIGKRKPRLPVVLTTGRVDLVEWIVNRGGVALIKPYSIERLKAVFTEQLCPPSPESTSSQTRVVVKRARRKTIDPRQIDLKDSTDVRYWCRRFRCTQSALRAAIKLLGTDPASVEKYLMTRPSR